MVGLFSGYDPLPTPAGGGCDGAFFELFPRRKKFDWKAFPADEIERIKAKWTALAQGWVNAKTVQKEALAGLLRPARARVDLTPMAEMHKVYTSNTGNYRSQGYGADRYAKGDADMKADMLREVGFTTEVVTDADAWGTTYNVLANAAPWQFDAVKRRQTVADFKRRARAAGVNARVYNPFLPYDD